MLIADTFGLAVDAGYGMVLTEIDKISASGDMIKNPSPVNADNIKTQTNGRATKTAVLSPGTCNVSNAVDGGVGGSPEAPKVTTLAGTTWKMNDVLTDFSFLEMFDVGKVEQLNVPVRWQESNPMLNLQVPVGLGKNTG